VVGTVVTVSATEGIVNVAVRIPNAYSLFVAFRGFSTRTQNCTTKNNVYAIANEYGEAFGTPLIEHDSVGSPSIVRFLSAGIYFLSARLQVYRSSAASVARVQFYIRKGQTLPLTRADDLQHTSLVHAIDSNLDHTTQVLQGIVLVNAGDYMSIMMIADFPNGTIGIEATTGIVETGGYATPSSKSCSFIIMKLR
jgi:hypothetical protein